MKNLILKKLKVSIQLKVYVSIYQLTELGDMIDLLGGRSIRSLLSNEGTG